MKIYLIDYPDKKISHWHEEHFKSQGNEVVSDMYWDIEKAKWADVIISFWCEGLAQDMSRAEGITAKRIIQIVDIDGYYGHWRGVEWNNIDGLLFMSNHIRSMIEPEFKELNPNWKGKIETMPLGIDLNKWTFRNRNGEGKNISFHAAEWWSAKNPSMVLQFAAKLIQATKDRSWKFYWSGQWGPEKWLYKYIEHMIKELKLEENFILQFYPIEDMDIFWNDKDYLVTFSQKDSYSLLVGEAMAKGMKVLCHNWWDAKAIWPEKYIWTTLDELIDKFIHESYDSQAYRAYIQNNHDINDVLKKWDNFINQLFL